MPVDAQKILDASLPLNLLAKAYKSAGDAGQADTLFRVAAGLELASPELQECWGGPLNGQVGRQAIILELLSLCHPAAIIETGTHRGISTEWFARNYSGPIFSCEKEDLYFFQAQARLSRYSNVDLRLNDSRHFLDEILRSMPNANSIFLYLDAHWGPDLPLRKELGIIFARHPKAFVMIDDFRVPDDPGYAWDDYGPQGSLELTLVDDVIPSDARLFFPTLKSSNETGARRGCCVVAAELAGIVAQSTLLRGQTLEAWKGIEQIAKRDSIADKDRLLAEKDRLLAEKERLLAQQELLIADRDAKLKAMERTIPRKLARAVRRIRKRFVRGL